jgi:hypothetical protein
MIMSVTFLLLNTVNYYIILNQLKLFITLSFLNSYIRKKSRMQRWNMVVPIDTARVIDTNATLMGLNRTQYLIARGVKRVYMRREPTPPVEVIALLKILAELKRQGNNLNQIARRLNSGDSIDDVQIHLENTTKKITSLLNGWLD